MDTQTGFRPLLHKEIEVLEKNGCTVFDWSQVQVKDGFSPEVIRNVHFSGTVSLGAYTQQFLQDTPIPRPVGSSSTGRTLPD